MAVWGLTGKLTQISFLCFTFTTDISNLSIYFFFFFFLFFFLFISNWELQSFNLKVALNGFFLTYLNDQHHSTYGLGPLLSKIRVTWSQALWHLNSHCGNQVANGWEVQFDSHSGQEEAGWCEIPIILLRMTCNLKLISYIFLEFSI